MMVFGLIALIAGTASALMFASIVSGALISLVLVYLAPLPLMLAAIAWGPFCGAIAGLVATLLIAGALSPSLALGYALAFALPAWWLGHLVMLGRAHAEDGATDNAAAPQVEWYPLGRILLWIAALATLLTAISLYSLGSDASAISDAMRSGFAKILSLVTETTVLESDPRVGVMVAVVPVLVAASQMATLVLNLWLAAKVAAVSGRLRRPWPDLSSTSLPPMTLVALCVALAFSFFGGMTGTLAVVVTTVLMMAFALVGLAVLHTVTRGLSNRGLWLAVAYAIIFMFSVSLVLMTALGLADAVFGFRERFRRNRQPPPLPTS